jgi:hypothetical protein
MGSFTDLLDAPYFTGFGLSVTPEVPSLFAVSIDGRPFIIDDTRYQRQMLNIVRQGADTSAEPGEASLNNEGLWGRHGVNWIGGAGQRTYDHVDENISNRDRFFTSRGLDPWTPNQISLLNDTELKRASANTNLKMLATGGFVYLVDGTALVRTADMTPASPTFTTITGTPGSAISDITSDGTNIYIGTPGGVYKAPISGTVASLFGDAVAVQAVQVVNGRLLVGRDNVLNEYDSAGVETAVYTHLSTGFRFNVIWAGPSRIYAAGFADIKCDILKISVDEADGSLNAPTYATFLPPGEVLQAALFYAGFMILATTFGVRLASIDGTDGSLTYGPAIDEAGTVRCLDALGLYVWFGWTNMSGSYTGVGRLGFDSPFTATLTPPFASDLMAPTQGNTLAICAYLGRTYFAISGVGFYGETATLVANGVLDTGWITYGTPEYKTFLDVGLRHEALNGTISVVMIDDTGAETSVGLSSNPGSYGTEVPLRVGDIRTERARLQLTFNKGTVLGPVLNRWTIRAGPSPNRQEVILVPIILFSQVKVGEREQMIQDQDRMAHYLALLDLARTGRVVVYQEGNYSWLVKVEGLMIKSMKWDSNRSWFESNLDVTLLTV